MSCLTFKLLVLFFFLAFKNQKCFLTQGKVIGGSTTVNTGIYSRGHPDDYNRWADVYGNPGWCFDDVLPYFKKSENAVFSPRDTFYHGEGGYFTVDQTIGTPALQPTIISGFEELGVINSIDHNGKFPNGISKMQSAVKGNERVSTATAFLNNFKTRTNLEISLNSFVTNLLINKHDEAYGVIFIKNEQTYIAKAKKEIIVSAGAFNSPQILMLSGIGPKEHLEELGIPVIKDLPVGKNLSDHTMFPGVFFRTKNILYSEDLAELLQKYVHHEGPLTSGASSEMLGFINPGQNQSQRADIEFMIIVPSPSNDVANMILQLADEYASIIKTNTSTDILLNIITLHPKSRGSVTLKSKNPKDRPNIDPNYLAEPEDIEKIYEAVKFLIALNNTQAFRDYGAEMVVFDWPTCEHFGKLTEEWWKCLIKLITTTVDHPIATNRMGPDFKTSVVNARLRVHGIQGLRVADSSILPELNSGHTMAPVIMVGEKAADLIKEDWGIL